MTVHVGTTALPVGELVTDVEARYAGEAGLVAPAAVRLIDLDAPIEGLRLPPARDGRPYRSLLAVARLEGDPVGAATFTVGPGGRVPRQLLDFGLRRTLIERGARPGALAARWSPPSIPVSVVVTTCCNPLPLERCLRSLLACN